MKMKLNFLKACLFSLLFFMHFSWAETLNPSNYKIISNVDFSSVIKAPPGKILILDFFNYACPHCAHLSPFLATWYKKNAQNIISDNNKNHKAYIIFRPVPVIFSSSWIIYAQAFHIAKNLDQETQLNPKLFEIAQNPLLGLNSDSQMRSFFLHQNISPEAYDKAANQNLLATDLLEDKKLMKTFKIMEIPTIIIIDDKKAYLLSNSTVAHGSPEIFIKTLDLLTKKR